MNKNAKGIDNRDFGCIIIAEHQRHIRYNPEGGEYRGVF